MSNLKSVLAASALLFAAAQAQADVCVPPINTGNCAPPVGNVIFDLAGQPLPQVYTQYTVSFNAAQATTTLSFQFREDPSFFYLDDIVLTHNGAGSNLLTNGDFEGGTFTDPVAGSPQPNGWTYLNLFNAPFAGEVSNDNPHSGLFNYVDGSIGAYDGITQSISTIVGDSYTLSFWLTDESGQALGSQLSTGGGGEDGGGVSGIDLLVYAGALPTILPTGVPEPDSIALLGLGVAGLAMARRRTQK